MTECLLNLKQLLPALVSDGWIEQAQADQLLYRQSLISSKQHPLILIVQQKWRLKRPPHKLIDLETLSQWLASYTKLPYHKIDPLKIDVDKITKVVSKAYVSRFQILPIDVEDGMVTFATAQPFIREWETELASVLRCEIKRVIANPLDIERYRDEFYSLSGSVLGAKQQQFIQSDITNLEQLVELGKVKDLDSNDQHVVRIVDWLLQYAFAQRASDIHLEPRRERSNVRFRIDGMLHSVYQMPTPVLNAVVSRIKTLGRMDVVERRRPQDGRIKTRIAESQQEIELRLSTMPTAFGEKMVMRIFNPDALVQSFDQLGFNTEEAQLWQALISHPHGVILVTGPTGSGKTTTLYSTLKHLAKPELNVCTVEDPIEMVEPQLNQMQVQHNIGLNFASGIRTLLRQDPDIIMVGEIRDQETASMAMQSALTGHLVLSTLHTNDSASAMTRLIDLGLPAFMIDASLLGILAQRLVRTLCPHCKQPNRISSEEWQSFVQPYHLEYPTHTFRSNGCDQCRQTGYLGRMGLFEMLIVTPEIRKLLHQNAGVEAIRQQAYQQGTENLRINGARKIAQGLTTMEEVIKVTIAME